MKFDIRIDDLSSEASQAIVREHMAGMLANTPIESVHALPLEKLRHASVTFWTVWMDAELCGCGALQAIDQYHGEIKCMRTRAKFLRQGVAQSVLLRIISEAKTKGMKHLSLETGSSEDFSAARAMYLKFGFKTCEPFADYKPDPLSVFMTKTLNN